MRSTAVARARSWTVGILSASAVAAGIVGFHLADDHNAALAAGTSRSGTSSSSTSSQQSNQGAAQTDRNLVGDDGGSEQGTQSSQATQRNRSQNGSGSASQLAPGAGVPQVTTHGS